jgi:hypothetical protein
MWSVGMVVSSMLGRCYHAPGRLIRRVRDWEQYWMVQAHSSPQVIRIHGMVNNWQIYLWQGAMDNEFF